MRSHTDAVHRVESAVGERLVGCFDGAREHSPLPVVEAGRRLLEEVRADAVVAVGGGSAIVTARASTILLAERADVRDLCTRRQADGRLVSPRLEAAKLPLWVVPSTPTTAYAKAGSAVRDVRTGERLALYDPKSRAQGVFLDPVVAATAPAGLALASGLNAFAMAVDGIQSDVDDPLAEGSLRQALRMLAVWLPRLVAGPEDVETRLRLMLAALLCGQGSDHVGSGLAQALSHAAGPRSSASNGIVEALLLPHTMRFNAPVTGSSLVEIADALDTVRDGRAPSPERACAAVEHLLAGLRVPVRLRDVGLAHATLSEIVDHTLDDWAVTRVPRPAGRDELLGILDRAW